MRYTSSTSTSISMEIDNTNDKDTINPISNSSTTDAGATAATSGGGGSEDDYNLLIQLCKLIYATKFDTIRGTENFTINNCSQNEQYLQLAVIELLSCDCSRSSDSGTGNGNLSLKMIELKSYCMQLSMLFDEAFAPLVQERNVLQSIMDMLEIKLNDYHNQKTNAARIMCLLPTVVTIHHLARSNNEMKEMIKKIIFPIPFIEIEKTASIDPIDVPVDSIRAKLLKHMISIDSGIKQQVTDLLYLLCNEDKEEFIARCGYGNAVGLLQAKGLVELKNVISL